MRQIAPLRRRRMRAFSLIELIVVLIVIGALAAVAAPRYIALGRDARIAALNAMAGTLSSTAQNFHVMCKLDPTCNYTVDYQPTVAIGGQNYSAVYGWPNGGGATTLSKEIDGLINQAGFSIVHDGSTHTTFTLDGAPTPANCSVTYGNTYYLGTAAVPPITIVNSGC